MSDSEGTGWDDRSDSVEFQLSEAVSTLYLKEIELENFKSFRHKVRIPLLKGYTAITGPNGCGKSNIADAILFVLGPRSSKTLRAGKLTDLIWNGGKEGKAAAYCEVSLVFDNSDRVMPIETDEVKLTRRVTLSPTVEGGYNSYFYINDRKASLNEFDQLLAHARISAEGYNIVQQQDVQRIVSMSSIDRRRLLDDIAGITKFDDDITKANYKQKETEENLARIQIILEEIKKQLRQSDRDRAGALKYKELNDRLLKAKAQLALKNKEIIEQSIVSTKGQLSKYETEKGKLLEQKAKLEEELSKATEKLSAVEMEIAEKGGEEAKQLKERLDKLRVDKARAADVIETSQSEISRIKTEVQEASRERNKVEKELETLKKEKSALETQISNLREQLKDAEQRLAEVEENATKSDAKLSAIQKEIVSLNKKIDDLEEKAKACVLEGDRLRAEAERLQSEVAQLESSRKSYDLEVKDTEFQIKELKNSVKGAEKSSKKLQEDLYLKKHEEEELTRQSVELENAVKSLTREYAQLKAESEAADSLKKGYNLAVSTILEAQSTGTIKGIHGTIAQLGHVDEKYEMAILVAGGSRVQAIVVDDDAIAAECIEYLKRRKAGRAIFLPLNKMLYQRPRGKAMLVVKESLGFAIDLIQFDEKYRNAFSYVFGDTIVMETLDQARKYMGGIRMVTLGGELIEASGAMIGGEFEKSPVKFGVGTSGSLEEVAEKLRQATEQADKTNEKLKTLREELARIEGSLREATGKTSGIDVKLSALEAKRKEFIGKLNSVVEEFDRKSKKLESAKEEESENEARLEEIQSQLAKLRQDRDEKKKAVMEATPRQVATKLKEFMTKKSSLIEELSAAKAKGEASQTRIQLLEDRHVEIEGRIKSLSSQQKDFQDRIKNSQALLAKIDEELRALEKMEDSLGKEGKELQAKRDGMYKEKTRIEVEVDKTAHKIQTRDDFYLGLQTELKVQEEKLAEAEKEIQVYNIKLEGELPTLDELKRVISESENQIKALGPVNMRALEDFEEQSKRQGELGEELKHLKQQKEDLIKLVAELTEKKKEGLAKVFNAINENFKRVYSEMSEGGEAELALENEQDPFQGGLVMKVKPPDKKVLRLEALSGGEKSLVCMAFIVALQEYDPSPFYVLDEIDQNLDAVNAEKVARMVRRNSASAQFIQISLRKITLKEADHIIGATIQSNGVSDVVMKVNISEIEDEKPTEEVLA